jgi:hypothetical protein
MGWLLRVVAQGILPHVSCWKNSIAGPVEMHPRCLWDQFGIAYLKQLMYNRQESNAFGSSIIGQLQKLALCMSFTYKNVMRIIIPCSLLTVTSCPVCPCECCSQTVASIRTIIYHGYKACYLRHTILVEFLSTFTILYLSQWILMLSQADNCFIWMQCCDSSPGLFLVYLVVFCKVKAPGWSQKSSATFQIFCLLWFITCI